MSIPIDKKDISNWKKLNEQAGELESKFQDRFDYIIRKICETFNGRLVWWDFPNGTYGEAKELDGNFEKAYGVEDCEIDFETMECVSTWIIIDKDGSEYGFDNRSFPTRWLFGPFEEELKNGKKKYEDRQKLKKEKQKQARIDKKKKKEELIFAVKNKLSKEELRALGVK